MRLLPPTDQKGSRNKQGRQMNRWRRIMTKLVLCSEPHACAQTAVRQWDGSEMRMTDKDTPHTPKNNADEHRASTMDNRKNTLIKDRYRWPHRPWSCENNPRRFAGHIPQFSLAPLVDVVADCVCAFRGTLFSWPALDLRPRLTGLHLATVATSEHCFHASSSRRRRPSVVDSRVRHPKWTLCGN